MHTSLQFLADIPVDYYQACVSLSMFIPWRNVTLCEVMDIPDIHTYSSIFQNSDSFPGLPVPTLLLVTMAMACTTNSPPCWVIIGTCTYYSFPVNPDAKASHIVIWRHDKQILLSWKHVPFHWLEMVKLHKSANGYLRTGLISSTYMFRFLDWQLLVDKMFMFRIDYYMPSLALGNSTYFFDGYMPSLALGNYLLLLCIWKMYTSTFGWSCVARWKTDKFASYFSKNIF